MHMVYAVFRCDSHLHLCTSQKKLFHSSGLYINDLAEEFVLLADANAKDDLEDLDGDGKADVLDLDKQALVQRKF